MDAHHPNARRRQLTGALLGAPLVAAGLGHTAAAAREERPMPAVGGSLPVPNLPLLDGGSFRAADARGQVLVVYWWASWCPFCAVQTPHVQKLWETHRAKGLRVLGMSIDRRPEDASKYLLQRGYNFPSAWQTADIARTWPKPGKALPVTVVLGRDGRVAMAEDGQIFPEDIEQIARFLG